MVNNVEQVMQTTRAECLRGMESGNMDARLAWYYTHCGELEMAANLGAITIERMNALEAEWRDHNPLVANCPERVRDPEWTRDEARAYDMQGVADNAMRLLKQAQPGRRLSIAYVKPTEDTIDQFTDWQRERNSILTGNEYFIVWDYSIDRDADEPTLLYAVNVSADSLLAASAELMSLLSRKF